MRFPPSFRPVRYSRLPSPTRRRTLSPVSLTSLLQLLSLFLQLLDIQLQAVQFHSAGGIGQLVRERACFPDLLHDAPGHALRKRQLLVDFRDGVAGLGKVLFAFQYLLLQQHHLSSLVPGVNRNNGMGIDVMLDDKEQQHHRAEAA